MLRSTKLINSALHQPTTPGTVSLVLLRGPAENVIPIDCLGDNLPNTGTFTWTPSTSLTADTTHYGLQIIVTGTGQFQYSTQFGIVNPNPSSSSSSAVKPASSATKPGSYTTHPASSVIKPASSSILSYATSSQTATTTATPSDIPVIQINDGQPQVHTTLPAISAPIISVNSTKTPAHGTGTAPASSVRTYSSAYNSTVILPSKSLSIPPSLKTTTSKSIAIATPLKTYSSSRSKSTATTSGPLQATSTSGAGRAVAAGGMVGVLGLAVGILM